MEDLNLQNREELRRLRDMTIAPYIAQDWEVIADYPQERRVELSRQKKFSVGWFILGLIFYIVPGIIYWIYWLSNKQQKKVLLY